jgi:hypothetical protein
LDGSARSRDASNGYTTVTAERLERARMALAEAGYPDSVRVGPFGTIKAAGVPRITMYRAAQLLHAAEGNVLPYCFDCWCAWLDAGQPSGPIDCEHDVVPLANPREQGGRDAR